MKNLIRSYPTYYNGVWFRSRLEAHWACFFDQAKWKWEYEPIDLHGWTPDFYVAFPCSHTECCGSHVLLVQVEPFYDISDFDGHPCMDYPYGVPCGRKGNREVILADASAAFGINPTVTHWQMGHGAGGGDETIENWVPDAKALWKVAGNILRWHS